MSLKTSLCTLFFLSVSALSATQPADVSPQKEEASPSEKIAQTAPSSFCYFLPPVGWDISDPRTLSPRVQIGFIKKKNGVFSPSLNLAMEKVEVSQADYIKAIKTIHESDRNNRWRQLGKVHTTAGLADLTEIDTQTEWGQVRLLQLVLVKQGYAYVLTAAALKKEISQLYKEFQASFRSLQITEDLVGSIPQMERREAMKSAEQQLLLAWEKTRADIQEEDPFLDKTFQEGHWVPFQNRVINDYQDMGAYWQVLLLKSMHEKLHPPDASCVEVSS